MNNDYNPNDPIGPTVYRHTCEVCRSYVTSRNCTTWSDWMMLIAEFEREHNCERERLSRELTGSVLGREW